MTTYDFSKLLQDAKAGGAWPIGDYDFEVVDTMVKASSNGSGNEMIVAKMRCLVGPYANKHITNNFVLSQDSPNALNIFFRHMTAFGLDDGFFAQLGNGDLTPVAHALKGRRARITIGHRQWNGAMQNDIKAIAPLIEGMSNTIPGAVAGFPPAPAGGPSAYAGVGVQPAAVPPPPPPATPAPIVTPPTPVTQPGWTPPATPQYAPPPPPPPAAPAAPVAVPEAAPVAPPAAPTADAPPPGYSPELWASIPAEAKAAILGAAQAQVAAAPAPVAAAPAGMVPPPPPPALPV